MNTRKLLLTIALLIGLVACGGGGGGGGGSAVDTSTSSSAAAISGTAAFGAPITNSMNGVVTLKDSSSPALTSVTSTDASGRYSFTKSQIQGFTAPFLIEVAYSLAGTTYYLHSAVTAQDLTGGTATINVTPLTDLVIANLAGDIAQNVFNSGAFSSLLTPAALAAGVLALDLQLQPVLTQLGLSATLDLLHQSFNANGVGLDSLLDSVHVSIDPATRNVVLTNKLNGASTSSTLGSPSSTPLSATGGASVTDLQGIAATFNAFSQVMATNPAAASPTLLAFFDKTNFMDQGRDLSSFLQNIVGSPVVSGGGLSFANISLSSTPGYVSLPAGVTSSYKARFTVTQNTVPNSQHEFIVYKSGTGAWLILGNQLKAKVDFSAFEGNNNGNLCTGLQLNVADRGGFKGSNNVSISANYAVVTGPGLPSAGALLYQTGNTGPGNSFNLAATGAVYAGTGTTPASVSCSYNNVFTMTDGQIASIGSLPAVYTVSFYNVTANVTTTLATYTQQILAAPLMSSQLTTSIFPTNIKSSPSILTAAATGGTVNISWTAPVAKFVYASSINVFVSNSIGGGGNLGVDLAPGQTQQLVTVPTTANAQGSGATVEYVDSSFRTIWASPKSPL